MIRSLFSGVSGLRTHQTRMDVIGNNIANVNTTGFKAGKANFQDMLYQKVMSGGAGRNPAFVGTGVKLAGISANFNGGPIQNTGRTMDLAIQGNGFFKVTDEADNEYYTRDGAFFITYEGEFVNINGLKLAGATAVSDASKIETINISPSGAITGTLTDGQPFDAGVIEIYNFANPEGLTKMSNNMFKEEETVSGEAVQIPAEEIGGAIAIVSGYLEMSNVDLSDEFTSMITTQRGFQANARIITVSDTLLEELIQLKR